MTTRTLSITAAATLLAVGIATTAFAQWGVGAPGAGAPQGQGQGPLMQGPPPATMQVGTAGVFVLEGPLLGKYDAALKPLNTLDLRPAQATKGTAAATTKDATKPPQGPPPPGALLLGQVGSTEVLLAVSGHTFYRIDPVAFTITVQGELPAPARPAAPPQAAATGAAAQNAPTAAVPAPNTDMPDAGATPPSADGQPGGPGMPPPHAQAPTLVLRGHVLYVLRGGQVLAVNIDDATLIATAVTPAAAQAAAK